MPRKKILFLGAAQFQVPAIEFAKLRGHQIFTLDNIASNPGHRFADRTFNVSTADREAVLRVARGENINAVIGFASDRGTLTAAWLAREMGLPGPSLEVVELMTDKVAFRRLLKAKGLLKIGFAEFKTSEIESAVDYASSSPIRQVVKPPDSNGSKGVSIICPSQSREEKRNRILAAAKQSRIERVILEDFVEKTGFQVCGDGFFYDGRLVFMDFGDGWFHERETFLAPLGETFPSSHSPEALSRLRTAVEEVLRAIGFVSGTFNLDAIITPKGEPFIIEIGPRSGGNFIPSAIRHRTGFDMIELAVKTALGEPIDNLLQISRSNKFVSCFMIHSMLAGRLRAFRFTELVEKHLLEFNPYLQLGDPVFPFHEGNRAIGNLILAFSTQAEMMTVQRRLISTPLIELEQEINDAHL